MQEDPSQVRQEDRRSSQASGCNRRPSSACDAHCVDVWLHGVVSGRASGGCEWRGGAMVNFDETTLVLTNQSDTVDRAVCDVEVLREMKKAKRL